MSFDNLKITIKRIKEIKKELTSSNKRKLLKKWHSIDRMIDWNSVQNEKGEGRVAWNFILFTFLLFFFRFILFSFVCPVLSCFINFIFSSYVISYLMYFVMIERKKILTGFPLLSRTCITHITCSRRQKSPWLLLNWSIAKGGIFLVK